MKTATVDQPHPKRNFEAAMKAAFSVSKVELEERERKYKADRAKRKANP